jgi:CubicO group peptidase (beta-lactamase class C family)
MLPPPAAVDAIDTVAREHDFSGVVSVHREGEVEFAYAYGLAHRAHDVPNTVDTRFAVASGSKAMTALAVVSLIEQGALSLSTTARSVLGDDLPLIDNGVTVEHLLAHRSGIGDYIDEDADDYDEAAYPLKARIHEYTTTERFLIDLDGHPMKFPPGERFSYCNGGYMVLALIAERAGGVPFHQLIRDRVCTPAGLRDTDFLRSDSLPASTAYGYLTVDGQPRTNVFHLPILGNGDGGIYTTAADVDTFWHAFFAGRIVSARWVAEMVRPHSDVPEESMRYGLGFCLHEKSDVVKLIGGDAGVSFRSVHDPRTRLTHTVISNSSDGAWPVTLRLDALLGT